MAEYEDPIPSTSGKKRKSNDEENNTSESDSEEEDSSQPIEKKLKINNKKKIEENGHTKKEGKWSFLEHKGPVFAPPYELLPDNVKFYYDDKEIKLSPKAEEVASLYAKMLDDNCTKKDVFKNNFFEDWRKEMTAKEKKIIKDLDKCNFEKIYNYFKRTKKQTLKKKIKPPKKYIYKPIENYFMKEEKQTSKEKNVALKDGSCNMDGNIEKLCYFKMEPPGLFKGRGEHPKMGKVKRRIEAEDIIINCSKDSKIPVPPPGHQWKEVRHDDNVTWLASWTENVQNQTRYMMLDFSSELKGKDDLKKYETARKLNECIEEIQEKYKKDWESTDMLIKQRAVALYFIDKLALRIGNEKGKDQADTVGCCSLRVEHISLHEEKDGKEYVVVFDFLGKDSIRYYNEVPVEKRVFENLQLFMEHKAPGDDLFDRLNTANINEHLKELMEGLTAKVFRTCNASWTMQEQLDKLTNEDDTVAEKIGSYHRANQAVAILCNHQRSVPKGHEKSMEKLKEKIEATENAIKDAKKQVEDAKEMRNHLWSVFLIEKKKNKLHKLEAQLDQLKIQERVKDENKTTNENTSKLNYIDPRITVAWCIKYNVPIEKIYNKTERDKFRWAIDMAGPDYVF